VAAAEQSPEVLVVHDPTVPPLRVTLTVSPAANPVTLAVNADPSGPDDGDSDSDPVSVKVASAESPCSPAASTWYDPAGNPAGTMPCTEQSPDASVMHCPIWPLLNETNTRSSAVNPVTCTVNDDPGAPDDGDTDRDPDSVNTAVAVAWLDAPLAATVYDPAGNPDGAVILVEQSPEAPAVHCPAATPLKVTSTVSFAANPAADAVTVDPAGPDDGFTDSVGVVSNVAVAVSPLACPVAVTV
jgi:hypothetical protein